MKGEDMNRFLKTVSKESLKNTTTWNGALSNSGVGVEKFAKCLEYFAKAGTYTDRSEEDVNSSMASIFSDDAETATKIVFGTRLITRTPEAVGRKKFKEAQTGFGRRDEFYKAVCWMADNKPDILYKNLHLIPIFGSWKDFLNLPLINKLDKKKVYALFEENLESDLLKKYLPQIRSKKNAKTPREKARSDWAKGFIAHLGISPKEYRALKSSGKAHVWQKQMGAGKWDKINFNGVPGKAMFLHTSRKGKQDGQTVFERHGQIDRLMTWLKGQTSVKFTGYPYELAAKARQSPSLLQKMTYDMQFQTILDSMNGHKLGNVWPCLDTSGSMTMGVIGGTTAYDICVSMGVAFSMMNTGHFKDHVVGFDSTSWLTKLNGTFCDRIDQITKMKTAWGSTNFQSVIDLMVNTRKNHPSIPVSDYPDTLLVISDLQFDIAGNNSETNYEVAMRRLKEVGLNHITLIWWNVSGQATDFPSQMSDKKTYLIGGFDPINIKSLMGLNSDKKEKKIKQKKEESEPTPLDGLINWLSQPIFTLIKV